MARLFVAHVEAGRGSPVAGVADAIEERRRQQVAEKFAKEDQELKRVGLDLERQGLRLKRQEIAQRGTMLSMEIASREKMQGVEQAGLDRRQGSAQAFEGGEADKQRTFQAGEADKQRTFVASESGKTREQQSREARRDRKQRIKELEKQIASSEKIATDRINSEIEQLDKRLKSELERLNLQLQDAKAARNDARATEASKHIRQIEADRAAQVRAIQANKEQYKDEASSAASRQIRAIQAEEREAEKQRKFQANQRRQDQTFATSERLGTQSFESSEAQKQREFATGERLGTQSFRSAEADKDRAASIAELDAQIAAARENNNKKLETDLLMQRRQLEFTGEQAEADREFRASEGAADRASREGMQQTALDAEKENLLTKLEEARKEGDKDRAAALERDLNKIDAQMQVAEMQYGMPGSLARETAETLDAQIQSLDRIFAGLPEGQRPPAAAMERGKKALEQARQRIIDARTREEYNAAVTNAGQLYKSYQQEMEAAGQAVFTNRQNDRYTELMGWAGSEVGREHGITEARLAEVVSGDPSKRAEDISNLVQMKQSAQAYRRAELAIDALDEAQAHRVQAIATLSAAEQYDGEIDLRNLTPSQKLAYEAYNGMNDIGLSMSERAQAAQTVLRYANMSDDDTKFVDLTLESQRQEEQQLTLERESSWARSALAGPEAEFTEQDIMSSDFQDNLVSLAAMGDADASAALSIITEQDYQSLGAGGYRQLWAQVGNTLGPQGIMRLGNQLARLGAGQLQPEVWSAENDAGQQTPMQDTRTRGVLGGMRRNLDQDGQ